MVSIVLAMINRVKKLIYGIKSDKLLHFICAMITVQFLYLMFSSFGMPLCPVASASLTLAVCAIKELLDKLSKKGVASWGDFVAGIIGTVVGLSVMILT